jgi:hypothetical protein
MDSYGSIIKSPFARSPHMSLAFYPVYPRLPTLYLDKPNSKRVSMPSQAMTNRMICSRYEISITTRFAHLMKCISVKAFLSKEMMYSCALWSSEEGGVDGDLVSGSKYGDLEAAQRRKIHHVLKEARVQPGHRILEFGSGWGGLAIEV